MAIGDFVWFELMTRDADAAAKFYDSVVGWNTKDSGMPETKYLLASAGETMVAGILSMGSEFPEDTPARWTGYVAVADVDAAADNLKATGGEVHKEPADIPNVGRFAVVADPEGGRFVLFQGAGTPPPAPAYATPGIVGWNELMTTDLDRAWSWYEGQFGWRKAQSYDMGPHGVYQTYTTNEAPMTGGMMGGSSKPRWKFYFNVPDINGAVATARELGAKIERDPMQVPGGSWVVEGIDPVGATFNLIQPAAS
jgi:uncharacterized protein